MTIFFSATGAGKEFPPLVWIPAILSVISLIFLILACTKKSREESWWQKWKCSGKYLTSLGGNYEDFKKWCKDYEVEEPSSYVEFKRIQWNMQSIERSYMRKQMTKKSKHKKEEKNFNELNKNIKDVTNEQKIKKSPNEFKYDKKILLISDCHLLGNAFSVKTEGYKRLERILKFVKPDIIIDCGDIEDKQYLEKLKDKYEIYSVDGNWDEPRTSNSLKFSINDWNFFIAHGDIPKFWKCIKFTNKPHELSKFIPDYELIKKHSDADIICMGHLHQQLKFFNSQTILNPGSVNYLHHLREEPSVFTNNNGEQLVGILTGSFDVIYVKGNSLGVYEYLIYVPDGWQSSEELCSENTIVFKGKKWITKSL
ncbi:MAG: YfcE family phosphodiesterase [Mycoplasmataceae bacterium]|nr:YfcE family phosphodiesterase [Mycoplasmataceae bacterium]